MNMNRNQRYSGYDDHSDSDDDAYNDEARGYTRGGGGTRYRPHPPPIATSAIYGDAPPISNSTSYSSTSSHAAHPIPTQADYVPVYPVGDVPTVSFRSLRFGGGVVDIIHFFSISVLAPFVNSLRLPAMEQVTVTRIGKTQVTITPRRCSLRRHH